MLTDRIEHKWIKSFTRVFELSKVAAGDTVAILSETQSRQLNVQIAELALLELGAKAFHVVIPSAPVPCPPAAVSASHGLTLTLQ